MPPQELGIGSDMSGDYVYVILNANILSVASSWAHPLWEVVSRARLQPLAVIKAPGLDKAVFFKLSSWPASFG